MPDTVLTLTEASELLKCSEKTLTKLAKSGEIPSFKVGMRWRFRRGDLDQWMQEQVEKQASTINKKADK